MKPLHARPRNRKQLLLKLGAFLLLLSGGAIINVAVAWGCATLDRSELENEQSAAAFMPYGLWKTSRFTRTTEDVFMSFRYSEDLYEKSFFGDPAAMVPRWAPFATPSDTFVKAQTGWVEMRWGIARGFPLLSLWSERAYNCSFDDYQMNFQKALPAEPLLAGGVEVGLRWPTNAFGSWPLSLPLRPIWPGFAINTICYAALLWVMWITPGKIRRFVRIRGHRCPACGYKIDSAPGIGPRCSECGTPLPRVITNQV